MDDKGRLELESQGAIVIRPSAGGASTAVALDPPIADVTRRAFWGRDERELYEVADHGDAVRTISRQLLRVTRDGTWTSIGNAHDWSPRDIRPSSDGSHLALTLLRPSYNTDYYPILR